MRRGRPQCFSESVVSGILLKASWISIMGSMWKSVCRPSTPFDKGTTYWQIGQVREHPSLATSCSRHGTCKRHGSKVRVLVA